MRLLSYILITINSCALLAQDVNIDDYLVGTDEVPKVLLVGTFHFGYPGLDTHKTIEKYKLDILSQQRQSELRQLLDYIKRFKPTKIMIEAGKNTGYLMNRMRRWQNGEEKLRRSESDQLGIRLVHELKLDTIYGINAMGLSLEMTRSQDSTEFRELFSGLFDSREEKTNVYDERYWDWYDIDDQLTYEMPLLDYFKFQNSDKVIDRMHGHYVLDDGYDDTNNMDGWFLLNWYSRNLRIFKNLQRIQSSEEDRILVIFGAAHISILKHQLEASPEYELVKFKDLERL